MPTIAEAKEYIEHCQDFCDGHADALIAACDIALAAEAYFKLSCQTREEDRAGLADARHELWTAVRKARENGVL